MCHCWNEEVKMLWYQYSFLQKLWVTGHQRNDLRSDPVLTLVGVEYWKQHLKYFDTSSLTSQYAIGYTPTIEPSAARWIFLFSLKLHIVPKWGSAIFIFLLHEPWNMLPSSCSSSSTPKVVSLLYASSFSFKLQNTSPARWYHHSLLNHINTLGTWNPWNKSSDSHEKNFSYTVPKLNYCLSRVTAHNYNYL